MIGLKQNVYFDRDRIKSAKDIQGISIESKEVIYQCAILTYLFISSRLNQARSTFEPTVSVIYMPRHK